jgi:hypothetical protein
MTSTLNDLAKRIYGGNVERGFHEEGDAVRTRIADFEAFIKRDRDTQFVSPDTLAEDRRQLGAEYANYATKRIALIVTEAAEAIEELRKGRAPGEAYHQINGLDVVRPFPNLGDGVDWVAPLTDDTWTGVEAKPEGVPSELADILIRTLDVMVEFGIDPEAIVEEKLTYNATRGRMHGGKAF